MGRRAGGCPTPQWRAAPPVTPRPLRSGVRLARRVAWAAPSAPGIDWQPVAHPGKGRGRPNAALAEGARGPEGPDPSTRREEAGNPVWGRWPGWKVRGQGQAQVLSARKIPACVKPESYSDGLNLGPFRPISYTRGGGKRKGIFRHVNDSNPNPDRARMAVEMDIFLPKEAPLTQEILESLTR